MTHHTHFSRPAIAAIAAVLALSTAPAIAQPAAEEPVVEPSLPPVTAEPAPAPEIAAPAEPAQVQIAPPSEVVQAIPDAEPEAATPAAAVDRAPVQTRATPTVASPTVTSKAPSTPANESLERPAAAPTAVPVAEPASDVAATQVAASTPQSVANSEADNATWWALGAGGLLFVGGVAALALSRGKRQPSSARAPRTAPAASKATPAVVSTPAVEAATALPEPIVVDAAAMTSHRRAKAANADWPELEDMVAEAPSAENPFLTRSKRIRRAKFLIEHGEPQPLSQTTQPGAVEPVKTRTAAKTANGKQNTTYSFGGKVTARPNWKPATT